ncbi:hypothetical protein OROGR_016201 [Orobanche gracilis]
MAFTIAASVLGQVIGSRAERHRLKARKLCLSEYSKSEATHCGEIVEWKSDSVRLSLSAVGG